MMLTPEQQQHNQASIVNEHWHYDVVDNGEELTLSMFECSNDHEHTVVILEDGLLNDNDAHDVPDFVDRCTRRAALMAAAPIMYQALQHAIKRLPYDLIILNALESALPNTAQAEPI